ncbi:MAG: hypothetical protein IKG03_07100 [Clostridiales bacterium]|nr:hypothetical protein [Clostridiales bacterium]
MKKHARLTFGITKKTRFAATMVVIAVVLVLALIVLGYVGVFGLRSELCEVSVTTDKAGDSFGGTGINCDLIPNINLIRDASFESSTDYASMLVAGASEGSIFMTPDAVASSGYDTASCSGDTARILSIDSDGVMSEKFTGTITGFKPARLGVVTLIKDTKDLWDEDRISEMAFYGNTVIALTGNGRIIYDVMNSQLSGVVDADERFALIESNDTGVVAVGQSGSVYYSQDARNLVHLFDAGSLNAESRFCGIGSSGSTFAVCYSDGTIVTVTNGKVALSRLPCTDVTAFVSDGERFLAVDVEGSIYSSSNGMIYETAGNSEWLKDAKDPLICAAEGVYCIVIDNEKEVLIRTSESGCVIEEKDISKITGSKVNSVFLTDSGLIVAGTTDKKAFAINLNTGKTAALASENIIIENIIGVTGDKVYYDSGKDIYKSQILSELTVEGNLDGVDIIADDILVAGHLKKAAGGTVRVSESNGEAWSISDDSAWNVYGNGTSVTSTDRANSGRFGARLIGNGSGVHAMIQELPGSAKDNFTAGTFYRLSFYAMSDSSPEKAYCWIEGDGFGRYGFELTQIGRNYKYFSYVFAVTDYMIDAENIRINVAMEGSGNILLDDFYLGPDSYDTAGIPQYYSDTLASGRPSAVRLNNLNIGSSGFAATSLYLMSADSVSCGVNGTSSKAGYSSSDAVPLSAYDGKAVSTSLEDSLKLVKKCSSSPWFVIGPYVDQGDIDKLLEYLCGSLTSEYGGRRIDNGTALPWSRQFTRFYIEINDSGKVFKSDVQKAAYVNYVISMFSQSEYFSDIKDKTLFLDGMTYDGGTMMSDADNHTMGIKLVAYDSTATYIDNINTDYVLARYDSPHVVSGSNSGEYINTLDTSGSNCGRIVSAIITKEADFAEMFLFDASVDFVPSKYTDKEMFVGKDEFINMMTVSGLTADFAGFDELFINIREPLDQTSTQSVDQFMSNTVSACFSRGSQAYLIIANPSSSQQSFLINDNKLGRSDSVIRRYDEKGRLINERTMRYEHLRHILQPGEFIIVEVSVKDNKADN